MCDGNNCLKDALFEMTQSYNYYSHLALKKPKMNYQTNVVTTAGSINFQSLFTCLALGNK